MNEDQIPVGNDYLNLIWSQDEAVEKCTDRRIAELGRKAPSCLTALGTALSHIDRLASCFYGCHGGDHLIEYLTGRVCGLSRSAIRLTRFANYDEALLLIRTIGEMANLVQLFSINSQDLFAWKNSSKTVRITNFGPAAVRRRLEELKQLVHLDRDWYGSLCEWAAHPTPATKPNAFNSLGIPCAAPQLQDEGVIVCLNELARVLCIYIPPVVSLLPLTKDQKTSILREIRVLPESLGGVMLDKLPEIWAQHRLPHSIQH